MWCRSWRKHKLSPATDRKAARIVTSSTKNHQSTLLQWIRSCWKASGRCLLCFTSAAATRCRTCYKAPDVCCWSHGQIFNLLEENSALKQELSFQTTASKRMFGGEKVRLLTTKTLCMWASCMWGCFAVGRTGALKKVDWIMKKEDYPQILQENLNQKNVVFQWNREPENTSTVMKEWLNQPSINVPKWLPRAMDPMTNL